MQNQFRYLGFAAAAILAAAATFALAPAARASAMYQTSYTLNVDFCSVPCLNGGTGGTITLTQGTNAVTVSVSLNPVDFHNTAAFDAFAFNISGSPTISVSGLPSGWALDSTTAGSIHEDGAQNFLYAIDASGANFTGIDSITFTVDATGLTTDDFHLLSTKQNGDAGPVYFAAAVYNTQNTSCTGVIGANGGTTATYLGGGTGTCSTTTNVPEPSSLALLGMALTGFGFVGMLRRRKSSEPFPKS